MRLNPLKNVMPILPVSKPKLKMANNGPLITPPYSNSNRKNGKKDFADYFEQELKKV